MGKIVNINTVCRCNHLLGEKTLHPLAAVVDLSNANVQKPLPGKVGFYSVLLKEHTEECATYGRKACDYSDGTLIFLSPGEWIEMDDFPATRHSNGWLLVFQPALIGSPMPGIYTRDYPFFTYNKEESLHVSRREKRIFMKCLENISEELQRSVDCHTRTLLSKSVGLLLDYCTRFYDRQFITRCEENRKIIKHLNKVVDKYIATGQVAGAGLPTTDYCAAKLTLSPSYLEYLLKIETGTCFEEYLQHKRMDIAKNWLLKTNKPVTEIYKELGFTSLNYFTRLFYKLNKCMPNQYRL